MNQKSYPLGVALLAIMFLSIVVTLLCVASGAFKPEEWTADRILPTVWAQVNPQPEMQMLSYRHTTGCAATIRSSANVLRSPDGNSEVIARYPAGQMVDVVSQENGFGRIVGPAASLGGQIEGWVIGSVLDVGNCSVPMQPQ